MQAVKDAIDSFDNPDIVIVENPIADLQLNLSANTTIDAANIFSVESGAPITVTVESNSNSDVATASISGNTATITAGSAIGITEITFKGTAGAYSATDKFIVKVLDPASVVIYSEDFEDEPTDWTYTNEVTGWRWGAKADFASSQYWKFEDPITGSKFIGANSDEAGQGKTVHDFLISPVIDLTNKHNICITYDYCFNDDGSTTYSSIMKLLYRTSPSSDWIEIKNYDDIKQRAWITDSDIVVSFDALTATTQFAVEYDDYGHWAYGGGVDNFNVNAAPGEGIHSNSSLAKNCELFQNYPNPFNPTTSIAFNLDINSMVKLTVFNTKGEVVANLVNKNLNKGMHNINFNASSLNSGVYYYSIEVNGAKLTKKMLLVK